LFTASPTTTTSTLSKKKKRPCTTTSTTRPTPPPTLHQPLTSLNQVRERSEKIFQEMFEWWQDMPWQARLCPRALEVQEGRRLSCSIVEEREREKRWSEGQKDEARLSSTMWKKRLLLWAHQGREEVVGREEEERRRQEGERNRCRGRAGEAEREMGDDVVILVEALAKTMEEEEKEQYEARWAAEEQLLSSCNRSKITAVHTIGEIEATKRRERMEKVGKEVEGRMKTLMGEVRQRVVAKEQEFKKRLM